MTSKKNRIDIEDAESNGGTSIFTIIVCWYVVVILIVTALWIVSMGV